MSKILILAETGFGKTSSIGPIPQVGIKGLNPEKTFIISSLNKSLPFPGWRKFYKPAAPGSMEGNYAISNDGNEIARIINFVNNKRPEIENIILDDTNYIMQDYYMAKAMTSGYDVFKKIGAFMGAIFNEMEKVSVMNKNFIMMAHHEEYKNSNIDTISFRFKTVGKMVQDYITPEGKFEIVLFGKQSIATNEEGTKSIVKQFVTNYDGQYPAKSPVGMFDQIYIPNDLGYVVDCIRKYEHGE